MFFKIGVLKNFAKSTWKHQCKSLFFNKVETEKKKTETLAQLISCEFCEIFKSPFLIEHIWWMHLYIIKDLSAIHFIYFVTSFVSISNIFLFFSEVLLPPCFCSIPQSFLTCSLQFWHFLFLSLWFWNSC